jgi:hypothetical protein
MLHRIRRPSPALVVALVALFVALSGSAVAAGIVAHAKLADNAKKLAGKTPTQVAAMAPAPTSLAGYITVETANWSLNAQDANDFTAACDSGQKAIAGGYDGDGLDINSRPAAGGGGWTVAILNPLDSGTSGTVYAVCLR